MRLASPFIALGCALALVQPTFAEETKPSPKKELESQEKLDNFEVQDLTSKKSAPKGKTQLQDLSTTKTQDKSSATVD